MKAGSQEPQGMRSSASKESKPIDWERLAAILSGFASIEYAMVFGSARKGIVCAGSDLDVAVSLTHGEAQNVDLLLEIVGRVEDACGVPCDLTVLNTAGAVLRHEALKGRVLFIRPSRQESFSEFYVRTCAEYEDLMVWRARQLAYRGYPCPSMPINSAVESKLRFLEQTLADLESWPLGEMDAFADDSLLRRAVERALQLAVESMIDVAERILAARCLPPANAAAQNFKRLQEIGILKDAGRYAEMVRFRNFIVHRYEQIEPQIVYGLAKSKLGYFRDFVDEIRRGCAGA